MNNDLHLKVAFDVLFTTLSKLVSLKEKCMVSNEDSEKAAAELKRALTKSCKSSFRRF